MAELEPYYECPVCLGTKLKKLQLKEGLLLDCCSRCGGIWFDYEEVHALRNCRPKVLWRRVTECAKLIRASAGAWGSGQ